MFYFPDTMSKWPWQRTVSPHFHDVDAESDAWFRSLGVLQPRSQTAFDRGNFGLLAALAYPKASREHFRTACDIMRVTFIIDEYTDIADAVATRQMVDIMIDALHNPDKPRAEGEVVLGELVRQFWVLAARSASAASQRHFLKEFPAYLRSLVTEAADRDTGNRRSIDGYMAIRRDTIGTRPVFMALELALELPDDVYYHPQVVALAGYISDIIILDNDIASYSREQATGDENHNIVTVAMHELGVDIGSAVAWAAGYHGELAGRFIGGLAGVPSWGAAIDAQLQVYLHGMANWARANSCWSFESGRYFGTRGREIQRTRLVPVLPKSRQDSDPCRGRDVVVPEVEM
ncbi:terpenoid synthase [Leucogyrophana mollusca]|uniref:Terpenoid synthase n=1 Tax=Leucogyrophana mollusca TaxID=85980 RepID=A0ACB8BI69_9AGAM|nr:terpenoid synthase [Leucogyrophana mollusca]